LTTGPIGTRYRVSAYVRSAANTGGARLQVREYNGGTLIGSARSNPVSLSPSWQLITVDLVTGAAGSYLDVQVYDATPVVNGEVFQADAISIQTVP
jgi:hypothetical protein